MTSSFAELRTRLVVACRIAFLLAIISSAIVADEKYASPTASATEPLWTIQLAGEEAATPVVGRIYVEAQDGGLVVEERNGRLTQLKPEQIQSRVQSDTTYSRMNADELAQDLLQQAPPGFEIHQTEHYVLCTNSAEEYAVFCGKLLEKVHQAYFEFMTEHEIAVTLPTTPLPVIVFHTVEEFQAFAIAQHPETTFTDTPGYYSIRDNQTLLLDLTRDRSLRSSSSIRKRLAEQPLQVATIVHEAVHQLAFNSGLQVRLADNPLWLTEGLAMYFEQTTPRATLLWTKPGQVNARHQPAFVQLVADDMLDVSLSQLVNSDAAYLNSDTVAAAYAEGWALTAFAFKGQPTGLRSYFATLSQRKPLQPVTESERLEEFRTAFGKSPDELQTDLISFVRRLRVPK